MVKPITGTEAEQNAEMKRRMALLMLYSAFMSKDGKSACAKGCFGPEIEGILAAGYAQFAHGGIMMTEAGAMHWEIEITQVASTWAALSPIQIGILRQLDAAPREPKSGEPWVLAANLHGYQAYDETFRGLCRHLCKIDLAESQRLRNYRMQFKITPKGRNALKHIQEAAHATGSV